MGRLGCESQDCGSLCGSSEEDCRHLHHIKLLPSLYYRHRGPVLQSNGRTSREGCRVAVRLGEGGQLCSPNPGVALASSLQNDGKFGSIFEVESPLVLTAHKMVTSPQLSSVVSNVRGHLHGCIRSSGPAPGDRGKDSAENLYAKSALGRFSSSMT